MNYHSTRANPISKHLACSLFSGWFVHETKVSGDFRIKTTFVHDGEKRLGDPVMYSRAVYINNALLTGFSVHSSSLSHLFALFYGTVYRKHLLEVDSFCTLQ